MQEAIIPISAMRHSVLTLRSLNDAYDILPPVNVDFAEAAETPCSKLNKPSDYAQHH